MSESAELSFTLSGLPLRLRDVPPELARRLREDWAAFGSTATSGPWVDAVVQVEGEPLAPAPFSMKTTKARFRGDIALYEAPEGAAEVHRDGTARLRIPPADPGTQYWALVNLLLACLAWCLPARRAIVLHAAAAVVRDRAFVMVGPAGSGKTTWTRLARSAGARVLSDDVVLLDASGAPRVLALSTPFRAERPPEAPGRWRVASFLLPAHGEPPRLAPVPPWRLRAALTANLPWLAEALEIHPDAGETVETLARSVPAHELTFDRSPSFLDVLAPLLDEPLR